MEVYSSIKVFLQFFNSICCCFFMNNVRNYSCYGCDDENKGELVLQVFEVGLFLMVYFYCFYDIVSNDYDDKKKMINQNKLNKIIFVVIYF